VKRRLIQRGGKRIAVRTKRRGENTKHKRGEKDGLNVAPGSESKYSRRGFQNKGGVAEIRRRRKAESKATKEKSYSG